MTRQDLPHVWACSCSLVGQNPEAVRQSCWFWDGSTWGQVSGVGGMWGHLAAYHVAQQNVVAWGTVVGCWGVGAGGTSCGCGGVWCLCSAVGVFCYVTVGTFAQLGRETMYLVEHW